MMGRKEGRTVRCLKWLGVGAIVLLSVWTLWNWWATARLESVVEALREKGLPTTLEELEIGLPPFGGEPPREENAAPLLEAAFALAQSVEPSVDGFNAIDLPEVPDGARAHLVRYGEAFDLLYEAAERPRCRFILAWRDGYAMVMSHLSEMRRLGKLLAARAILRARAGDADGAIEDVRVVFALSRAFREEPVLISQLIRIAIADMGLTALKEVLPKSPAAVRALERASPDRARGAVAWGLHGELPIVLSAVAASDAFPDVFVAVGGESFPSGVRLALSRPYIKSDLARAARLLGELTAVASQPYPRALDAARGLAEEAREGGIVSALLLPSVVSPLKREAMHASRAALVELGAKCIDYRRVHGRFPESIGELPGVEPDPLTGTPFVLERRAGGIRLQSERHSPETANGENVWELDD